MRETRIDSLNIATTFRELQEEADDVVVWKRKYKLEQYGRKLYLRAEGFPADKETSGEVLDKVQSLIKEADCDIPELCL